MRALLLCSTLLGLMQGFLAVGALAGEVVKVSIGDLAFAPANITVRVGDTIEWNNTDFVDHTATAKNGDGALILRPASLAAWNCTVPER